MCCGQPSPSSKKLQPTLDNAKYVVKSINGELLGEFTTNVTANIFAKKNVGSKVYAVKG